MVRPSLLLMIALGGAIGALLRFGITRWSQTQFGTSFPIGTLIANVLGCLAMGFCLIYLQDRLSPIWRDGLRIGLLGALTTFSTYCGDSYLLFEQDRPISALINLFGSVLLCLAATAGGVLLARQLLPSG